MDEILNAQQVRDIMDPFLGAAEAMVPRLAKIQRIYYSALLSEGFTAEDAVKIVCNYSLNPK